MSEINPAARFWLNPYDAERTRLQEAVVDAALVMFSENPNLEPLLAAIAALLNYTAPKHKSKKAAQGRRA